MKKILVAFFLMVGAAFNASGATVNVAGQTNVVNGSTQINANNPSWWLFNIGTSDKSVTFQLKDTADELGVVDFELWNATNVAYPSADTTTKIDAWQDQDTAAIPGGSILKTFTFLANSSYLLYFGSSTPNVGYIVTSVSAVPVPAAIWLFGSALMGLVGFSRRKAN